MGVFWPMVRMVRKIPVPPKRNRFLTPGKHHHLPNGFKNNENRGVATIPQDLFDEWQRIRSSTPLQQIDLQRVEPNLKKIHSPGNKPLVTWVGHSTVLVQCNGLNVLTDPIFSRNASPVPFTGPKRHQPPGLRIDELPFIDVVLISHSHYDHLDLRSVRKLAHQKGGSPLFAVPLGLKPWFKRLVPKANVCQLDWWENIGVKESLLTFVPTKHWSARSIWDRNSTLWGGWVVETDSFKFFFSGDVAYSDDILSIRDRFGRFDFSAISIGHYEPRALISNHHVNPPEAVDIHRRLMSRHTLGIHWGTFERLTLEPLSQAPRDLAIARDLFNVSEDEFFVLRHGESREISLPG